MKSICEMITVQSNVAIINMISSCGPQYCHAGLRVEMLFVCVCVFCPSSEGVLRARWSTAEVIATSCPLLPSCRLLRMLPSPLAVFSGCLLGACSCSVLQVDLWPEEGITLIALVGEIHFAVCVYTIHHGLKFPQSGTKEWRMATWCTSLLQLPTT